MARCLSRCGLVCVAGLGVGVLTAMPSWMQWVSPPSSAVPRRVSWLRYDPDPRLVGDGAAPADVAQGAGVECRHSRSTAPHDRHGGHGPGSGARPPGLLLAQGTGSLGILVGVILPGGLGTYEVVVISSFAGPGGLTLASAGVLAVGIRIVHLLGLGSAGIMFAFWAKVLTAGEVMADVEQAQGGA